MTRPVPARVLPLTVAPLAVPVIAMVVSPGWIESEGGLLVWLPAIMPAFLLSYYRGWQGATLATAAAMATLALSHVEIMLLELPTPRWGSVATLLALLLGVALGAGWLGDVLLRERHRAETAALTDPLTGIANRRHASVFLNAGWGSALRGGGLAVVLFDLDHFRRVNDERGHSEGDRVLQTLAAILTERTRRMDLSSRFGGERFVSILLDCSLEHAISFAEDVRRRLARVDFGWGRVTVSAGVASVEDGMGSPDELIADAERALSRAKRRGRDRVCATDEPTLPPDWTPCQRTDSGDERAREVSGGNGDLAWLRSTARLLDAPPGTPRGKILVTDDDPGVVRALVRLFRRAGYPDPIGVTDPTQVYDIVRHEDVDLVMIDLHMPALSGFEVISQIGELVSPEEFLPILVLTGDSDPLARRRALAAGAMDFLRKPVDKEEAEARVRNLLAIRKLTQRVAGQRRILEDRVRERTAELADTRVEILRRLALAAEYRDDVTGEHAERVGRLSQIVADELGLGSRVADLIRRAAPLHDLGKIGVPDAILRKPGPLTPAEFECMKAHTTIGGQILGGSRHGILKTAASIATHHHEHWDGNGYPDGLVGDAIPVEARIVAVVDAFDVLTHARPYKSPLPRGAALAELRRCSGAQFDPMVVGALSRAEARGALDSGAEPRSGNAQWELTVPRTLFQARRAAEGRSRWELFAMDEMENGSRTPSQRNGDGYQSHAR